MTIGILWNGSTRHPQWIVVTRPWPAIRRGKPRSRPTLVAGPYSSERAANQAAKRYRHKRVA